MIFYEIFPFLYLQQILCVMLVFFHTVNNHLILNMVSTVSAEAFSFTILVCAYTVVLYSMRRYATSVVKFNK